MIIISLDLEYFMNYTKTNINESSNLQAFSDNYSEQYHKAISSFDIIINSDRANTIYKDNIAYKCIVDYGSKKNKTTNKNDFSSREIRTRHSDNFKVGDVIQFENKISKELDTYLFTEKLETNDGYDNSVIQKCTETIKLYKNGILYRIPCVIGNNIYGSDRDDTKYLSTVEGQITVQVPNNEITQQISVDDIYKLGKFSYKCLQPNDIIKQGLLGLPMEYSDIEQVLPTFCIKILNNNVSIDLSTPIQLQTEIYDNIATTPLSPTPILIFESSDESIATVNNNGIITPISIGIVTITCKLGFDETISNSINITITDVVQDNFTYTITSNIFPISEVKLNQLKIYTIHKFNNGTEITGQFDISIVSTNVPTNCYTLSVLSDNSFSILALKSTHYLQVKCSDRSDNTKYIQQEIKLRSSM